MPLEKFVIPYTDSVWWYWSLQTYESRIQKLASFEGHDSSIRALSESKKLGCMVSLLKILINL